MVKAGEEGDLREGIFTGSGPGKCKLGGEKGLSVEVNDKNKEEKGAEQTLILCLMSADPDDAKNRERLRGRSAVGNQALAGG